MYTFYTAIWLPKMIRSFYLFALNSINPIHKDKIGFFIRDYIPYFTYDNNIQ